MISERNVRFLFVLSMIALFAAGVGVGFAISRLVEKPRPRHSPPEHGPRVEQMLERFSNELKLSPEQKQSVHLVMEAGRKEANLILDETKPQMAAIRKKLKERIAKLLDPEQLEAYQKLLARGRGLPTGPGPGPGEHRGPHGPGGHPPPPRH